MQRNAVINIIIIVASVFLVGHARNSLNTILRKILDEPEYVEFFSFTRNNKDVKYQMHYGEITVFIPTNEAFESYDGQLTSDKAYYYVIKGIVPLDNLKTKRYVSPARQQHPPLWITRDDNDIYVNNAKVLVHRSDRLSTSGSSIRKNQVIHVIDEILDPIIQNPTRTYDAYDFLIYAHKWHLGDTKKVTTFLYKLKEHDLSDLFIKEGGHTFFLPIDTGIDNYKLKLIDKYVILTHMVPNVVLFTRVAKSHTYETMANDDSIYTVISLEENDNGKMLVKANTVWGERKGEYFAEIVVANIPVANGVVHLISQPLGIFNRKLKPFPYLPIYQKISTDPNLNTFYEMGEKTGFNKIFTAHNVTFTYFVPLDSSFAKMKANKLSIIGDDLTILKRHLVVSETPYSMEILHNLSKNNNGTGVELSIVGGVLRISVLKNNEDYFIKWQNKYISVVRADYECTDGLVHVLAEPFANLQMIGSGRSVENEEAQQINHVQSYNSILKSIFINW